MIWQFFVICMTAAVTDILWRRVPNVWLAAWFLTGLLLAGLCPREIPLDRAGAELFAAGGSSGVAALPGPPFQAAAYLSRAAAAEILLYPAWRLGMTGAGDVKLCGLMAAWMGFPAFIRCFVWALFLGGAASFLKMICCHSLLERFSYFLAWFRHCISQKKWISYSRGRAWGRRETIPFSAALLGGFLLWLWV